MLRQIGFELFKMSRRPRTYLGYTAFFLINICIMIGAKYGDLGTEFGGQAGRTGFQTSGTPVNAEFMSWLVVGSPIATMLWVFFTPFFVCLVFGEIFGGEVADGTLRTVLTRPIRRSSLITAKFCASVIYALSLQFALGVSAFLIGWVFFGTGGLMATGTMEHPIIAWYPQSEAIWRLVLGYLLMSAGTVTVGMAAFFISSWLNNPLGAIGGSVMLLAALAIVGAIPWFRPIQQYLYSTHLLIGQQAFCDPIPWSDIAYSLKCLGAYTAGFFVLSLLIFKRKDILA